MDDPAFQPEPDWAALAPVVDELVARLPAADREVLLLRYYRNESHAAIAARFGLTEGLARKRSSRAIEKLRTLLGKRGIATSAAALASLLPAHAAPAAPIALGSSILQAAQSITPIVPSFLNSILLTVNSSQKIAFAGALLLLLAATGYTLTPDPSLAYATNPSPVATTPWISTDKPEPVRTRTPRTVPATPEERLERLKSILEKGNRTDRESELIAYLDGLPPDLFEETTRFLKELGCDRMALILTASAWAKIDPAKALDSVIAEPDYSGGSDTELQILTDWGVMDAKAALAWAATRSGGPEEAVKAVLLGVLKISPEEVGRLIRGMPAGAGQTAAFAGIAREMERDPALMQQILAGASDSQRAVIYGNFANGLQDPLKAAALLKEHPEAAEFASADEIYGRWASLDPDAAAADLAGWPPGKAQREGSLWTHLPSLRERSHKNPGADEALSRGRVGESPADRHPEIRETNPELALSQTSQVSDQKWREMAVATQLKSWLLSNPAAATAWLAEHPQPPAVLEKLPLEN